MSEAPQEPFVVNQDPGQNSSQSPPQINHNCCYECGDSLDDIFCQRCTFILEEENDVDTRKKGVYLEDILQIQDVILREKLLNISRLVTNIESLTDNPTPDRVLKSSFSFPIPVTDSDSFFEETDTSLSHLDNSLPEFETFRRSLRKITRRGSTKLLIK
ncbi:hypothetical protein Tco_0059942 [Tanacetum coccineum]